MGSSSPNRASRPLTVGLRQALLGPVNLGVAAAAGAAAAVLASWPLLVLGAAAYGALVAWDLSSQSFWNRVLNPREPLVGLPAPRELHDEETRAVVGRVHAARAEIASTAASSPESVLSPLRGSLAALDEMDARVGRLAQRSEQLSRYLASHDAGALADEAAELRERAARSADAETRDSYAQSAAARDEQMRTLGEIRAARERIVADLGRIAATLEGIPGRLLKMGALDAEAADHMSDDVGRELGQMNLELGAYEETLASFAEASATRS